MNLQGLTGLILGAAVAAGCASTGGDRVAEEAHQARVAEEAHQARVAEEAHQARAAEEAQQARAAEEAARRKFERSRSRMAKSAEYPRLIIGDVAPNIRPENMRSGDEGLWRHAWDSVLGFGDEPEGFGAYTYVLANRSCNQKGEHWLRYHALAGLIINTSHDLEDEVAFGDILTLEYNLFLFPVVRPIESTQSGGYRVEPNDALHRTLVRRIQHRSGNHDLNQRLENGRGPYLVTVADPKSASGEILYVDLSTTNKNAFPEVVAAYKRRLEHGSAAGVERLRSMRLALLSHLLDLSEHIVVIGPAMAGMADASAMNAPAGAPTSGCAAEVP